MILVILLPRELPFGVNPPTSLGIEVSITLLAPRPLDSHLKNVANLPEVWHHGVFRFCSRDGFGGGDEVPFLSCCSPPAR
jgi:hypothetical protein